MPLSAHHRNWPNFLCVSDAAPSPSADSCSLQTTERTFVGEIDCDPVGEEAALEKGPGAGSGDVPLSDRDGIDLRRRGVGRERQHRYKDVVNRPANGLELHPPLRA
jgi:hypothetical protein